jgi:peptidoglycan/LPS O-acetylase OafA/YrhL
MPNSDLSPIQSRETSPSPTAGQTWSLRIAFLLYLLWALFLALAALGVIN